VRIEKIKKNKINLQNTSQEAEEEKKINRITSLS